MSHDPERAYVAAVLDGQAVQLDRATTALRAELDAIREDWSTTVAHQVASSEARIRQMHEDNLTWLRSRYADDSDEGPQDVAGAAGPGADGASSVLTGTPGGHNQRSPQPTLDRWMAAAIEADQEADRIRGLSMQDYAVERQRLIRSDRGMF